MLICSIFFLVALLVQTDVTKAKTLIVGGQDADISQFPHQISLRLYGSHYCGGSIFKSNIIITAAHCTEGQRAKDFSIAAGYTLLSEAKNSAKVVKIINHEKYNKSAQYDYDVALLLLDRRLSFNSKVQPIALLTRRQPDGFPVTITGWGHTKEEGKSPNHLKQVTVNLVDNELCKKAYSASQITSRMLCAGDEAGGKDSCQADSGGPVIFRRNLIGIVSWGNGCGRKGSPGVYSSVPNLYSWIIKTANLIKI